MLTCRKFSPLCTIPRLISKVKVSQGRHLPLLYYSTSPDSDYLHKSKLASDHFQRSLPRLPIPELNKTCERYLQAQKPLLSNEEFAKTEAIVHRFRDGEGKGMHDELVALDKKNKHTSYITDPWSDMYLKDRRAVALNHNPFMTMNDDPRPEYNNQLIRATNLVMSSLRFVKTLRDGVLEPEIFHLNPAKSDTEQFRNVMRLFPKAIAWYGAYLYKAFPLDMSQHPLLFNTNRIPRPEKDEIVTDPSAKHLLVLHKGHLYTFDCLESNGRIKSAKEIMGYLSQILENKESASHPVGVLTGLPRDDWASTREKLVEAGNQEVLSQIDKAYFALVLDDETSTDNVVLSKLFLHGDGTNRWFDKCFSLMVAGNGQVSVNFEHSWGDGVAVLRYYNEVFKDTTERPHVHPDTEPGPAEGLRRLDFNFTDEIKADIDDARKWFKAKTDSLDLNFVQYTKYGKDFIKEQKLSPDSFMQLAIQLAFYRQYGHFAATYESCSTSAFKHGRTETVRPCTVATQQACEMFEKSGTRPSLSEFREAMKQCTKVHNQLTKEAAMGQGFDRHLFAMRYYADMAGKSAELFEDPNYKAMNHIIVSTSTLSSPALKIGGFGAVVPNGYGIGYGIKDKELGFTATGYPPNRDINAYLDCLQQSVTDMASILEGKDFK